MIKQAKFFITFILLILIAAGAYSFELGTNFRMGNLSLDQIKTVDDKTIDGLDFSSWGLSAFGSQNISENMRMDVGFYSDPVLKNISYTLFSYSINMIKLGVGPFFGFFNADLNTILKSGISTSIKVELPGILFFDFRTDSSLAGRLTLIGDYIQERTDLSFGFYVANSICTINMFSKKFTQKEALQEVINGLNEYSFQTILFKKNVPYKVTIAFGLQNLFKQFVDAAATTTSDSLYSIFVRTKLDIDITDAIQFTIDADNSVYTFGQENLLGAIDSKVPMHFFRASAGFKINLDNLTKKESIDILEEVGEL